MASLLIRDTASQARKDSTKRWDYADLPGVPPVHKPHKIRLLTSSDSPCRHNPGVDEGHLLSTEQLEELRLLTNTDMDARSPFSCVLLTQPTLRRGIRLGSIAPLA